MAGLNPTGPISAEEMRRIADLPYGQATAELRKHDPLWGRVAGETCSWRVRVIETVQMAGYVTVEADSEENATIAAEALIKAGKVTCDDFVDSDGVEVDWAELEP